MQSLVPDSNSVDAELGIDASIPQSHCYRI